MRKLILIAAVAALFMVALPIGAAGATTPEQVTFEGPSFFPFAGPGTSLFTAVGPAVDSGAMCPNGSSVDIYAKGAPNMDQSPNGWNLQLAREFTCDDGSGTFLMKLQVHITYFATFNWVVMDGTGDYEDLKGNGDGYSAFPIFNGGPDPIGVWDVYDGKLH
jgi:hypothetical protein